MSGTDQQVTHCVATVCLPDVIVRDQISQACISYWKRSNTGCRNGLGMRLYHTLIPTPSFPHPRSHTLVPTLSFPHPHSHTLVPTPSFPHPRPHTISATPLSPHHQGTVLEYVVGVYVFPSCPHANPRNTCTHKHSHIHSPIPQSLNPNVEAPLPVLLANLSSHLDSPPPSSSLSSSPIPGGGMTLTLNGTLSGLPFLWKFKCRPTEAHIVSILITLRQTPLPLFLLPPSYPSPRPPSPKLCPPPSSPKLPHCPLSSSLLLLTMKGGLLNVVWPSKSISSPPFLILKVTRTSSHNQAKL